MRNLFALLFCLFLHTASSQTPTDTTIYSVAEYMPVPMLNSCMLNNRPGWTIDSLRKCAEPQFLSLLSRNIIYPDEARRNNIQGMVVSSFVVETDGRISNLKTIKDIGGGCGAEALRVFKALDEAGLRFIPAQQEGKSVRVTVTVPLKFKLEDTKPYILNAQGDSVYVEFDSAPMFKGGADSLSAFLAKKLEYPRAWTDSCKIGIIEMSLLVHPNGSVTVENQVDYSNLGSDFQFNAIKLANRMNGLWAPAVYEGKPVLSNYAMRLPFMSSGKNCAAANADFEKGFALANEAVVLFDAGKNEEGLSKINEAVAIQPNNSEILYYRANAFLQLDKKEEACQDFTKIKSIVGVTWFENLGRMLCGW